MKSKISNKAFSVILSVSLILQMGMPLVYAEDSNTIQETKTITAFAELAEDVKTITVPVGTAEIEVLTSLPETLTATVTSAVYEEATEDVALAVTWENDKPFSSEMADTFTYIAQLTDGTGYTLAEAVEMPTITVTVINNEVTMTRLSEAGIADGGDITVTGLDLSAPPTAETTYKAGDGTIKWVPTIEKIAGTSETVVTLGTLTLNNATITGVNGIQLSSRVNFTIALEGENKISRIANSGNMACGKTVAFSGGGSLNINSTGSSIYLMSAINIESGTINVASQNSPAILTQGGINYKNSINISGGTVTATSSANYGISSMHGDVSISGGNIISSGQKGSICAGGKVVFSGSPSLNLTGSMAAIRETAPTNISDVLDKASFTGTMPDVNINVFGNFLNGSELVSFNAKTGEVNNPSDPEESNPDIPLIEGAEYGGDITETGLFLVQNAPTEVTQYKAGEGYVLFTPWSKSESHKNTIELNNATIDSMDKPSIVLPWGEVNLIIKGDNELYSNLFRRESSCIFGENTNIFVTGDGTLTATGKFSEIYGPPLLIGCGIRLIGNSEFTRDGQAPYKLNLIAYTEYTNRKEQEVFGSVIQHQLPSQEANLIIHKDAELTLQKPDGMGGDCEILLRSNYLNICENAKLIVDDEVCLNIEKNDNEVLPAVYNDGSILVRGVLYFRDSSYLKDIAKMNITMEGRGVVVVDGHLIDPASGKAVFNDERGEVLHEGNGGEWICGKGTMKWDPVVDNNGKLTGGTITLNNADISIKDSRCEAAIQIGTEENVPIALNIIGNNTIENLDGIGIDISDLTLTGSGTLNGKGRMPIVYESKFDTSNFGGKLNAIAVKVEETENNTNEYATAYGTVSYTYDDNQGNLCYSTLTVENRAQLTIEPGAYLNANTLTNNGTIINNGTLSPQRDADDNELKNWVYGNLNLKGKGIVKVRQQGGSACALFTNDGKLINKTVDTPLDFSKATEDKGDLEKDGYHWDNQNKKLTLKNLIMWGNPDQNDFCAVTLPEGAEVTLELKGYNKIEGFKSAVYQGAIKMSGPMDMDIPEANGSLTVCGDGTLVAQNQAYDREHDEEILTTTGKFILTGGNLIMASEGKTGLSSAGMEIKGGSIGNENICAPINSLGDFTMSGGKVIAGDGDGVCLIVGGDLSLSGGELITGHGFSSIQVMNGNVNIIGGKLTAYNNEYEPSMGILVNITGNEDKKISISGGTVDINSGMSALSFATFPGATGKGIFEAKGMTVKTDPAGGTLKSTTISLPGPNSEEAKLTLYALTADESLKARGPELLNACTSLTAVKTPSKPSEPSDGGDSHSDDGESSSSSSLSNDKGNSTPNALSSNLPKATVDALVKAGAKEVRINSGAAEIKLDLETLKTIQKQVGADVNVSVKKVDNSTLPAQAKAIVGNRPVFDITITGTNGKKVTNFGKGKVSVSIPYTLGENEKAENVAAYYIDNEGKIQEMPNSVYDEKSKTLTFVTDHFSKYAVGYKEDKATTFTDIANHWARNDIEFVTARGLFGGTGDGKFSPDMPMTRGMFVTVLGRLAEVNPENYKITKFTDVKADSCYLPYIEWANKNGIVNGTSAETFDPDQNITREQMTVIMTNYAKVIGFELPKLHAENTFADNAKIAGYAKPAVKQIQMAGIISGKSGNKFDPQGAATRAEVSAVFKRFAELIGKQ